MNHPALVDQDQRRERIDLPRLRDRPSCPVRPVPPRTPSYGARFLELAPLIAVLVRVDPEQDEGLTIKLLYERPLVRVRGPARRSPVSPEIEQYHLAPVVAQPHRLAVHVLALD